METKYMKLGEAIKYSGLGRTTLHKYDRLGVLVAIRTPTNRRMYTREMIDEFLNKPKILRDKEILEATNNKG